MSDWQRHLDIKEEWKQAKEGVMSIQQLAKIISVRLLALPPLGGQVDLERDDIAEQFADLSEDEGADVDDFDYLMEALYNWGDTPLDDKFGGKKVCWIGAAL